MGKRVGSRTEFDGSHEASTSHISNKVFGLLGGGKLVEGGEELLGSSGNILLNLTRGIDFLSGDTGGTGNSVTGISATQRTNVKSIHELLGGRDTGEGETVGDTLSEDKDVGSEIGNGTDGKVLAGSEETSLNFIDNEKDTVLVANLSKMLQEGRRARDVTTI